MNLLLSIMSNTWQSTKTAYKALPQWIEAILPISCILTLLQFMVGDGDSDATITMICLLMAIIIWMNTTIVCYDSLIHDKKNLEQRAFMRVHPNLSRLMIKSFQILGVFCFIGGIGAGIYQLFSLPSPMIHALAYIAGAILLIVSFWAFLRFLSFLMIFIALGSEKPFMKNYEMSRGRLVEILLMMVIFSISILIQSQIAGFLFSAITSMSWNLLGHLFGMFPFIETATLFITLFFMNIISLWFNTIYHAELLYGYYQKVLNHQ